MQNLPKKKRRFKAKIKNKRIKQKRPNILFQLYMKVVEVTYI